MMVGIRLFDVGVNERRPLMTLPFQLVEIKRPARVLIVVLFEKTNVNNLDNNICNFLIKNPTSNVSGITFVC